MRLIPVALALVFVFAATSQHQGGIRFSDQTNAARLLFQHESSATPAKFLLETMGGGVALVDVNGDGRLDVFFTNGAKLTEDMTPGSRLLKDDPRYWNRLFLQAADGTFADATEKAGLSGAAQGGYTMGVAAADYDNDGHDDLYVTAFAANTLYRNNGDGTFTDVTEKAGVGASGWSTSAGWLDYDRDGHLDLFVARYLTWSLADKLYCGERRPGYRAYCHPDNFKGIAPLLYRNNGDGTFTNVSEKAGIANPAGKGLGVAFNDYDNDGWIDIYVANDSVQSFLFRNRGDGTFTEEALLAGAGFNENGATFAGMGVDFADYDNDGRPDVFITDLANEMYVLYRNGGDGTFEYATPKTGVGPATLLFSGWGVKFADFDLDGWKDLFAAQGHVLDTIQLTNPHLRYQLPPLILRNNGKRFEDVGAQAGPAFAKPWAGRGAAFGDLDNDGDIDVVVANCGQPAYFLRNEARPPNWIGFRLTGRRSNRSALGAQVKVTSSTGQSQYAMVSSAGSYLSSHDRRLVFGFGAARFAKAEIVWPSGKKQTLSGLAQSRYHEITEPE